MTWSLIPLAVTVLAAIWAVKTGDESPGMYGGGAIFNLMVWMAALIVALIAWLVWAVLA